MSLVLKSVVVVVVLALGSVCHAQSRPLPDFGAISEDGVGSMVGAPVFAADGVEIGEVAEVVTDSDGQATGLRITTAMHLGIGRRTLILSPDTFTLLRGAAVLDLPSAALASLPRE